MRQMQARLTTSDASRVGAYPRLARRETRGQPVSDFLHWSLLPRRISTERAASPELGKWLELALSNTTSPSTKILKTPLIPERSSIPRRTGAHPDATSAAARTASSRWSQGTQYSMTTSCFGSITDSIYIVWCESMTANTTPNTLASRRVRVSSGARNLRTQRIE